MLFRPNPGRNGGPGASAQSPVKAVHKLEKEPAQMKYDSAQEVVKKVKNATPLFHVLGSGVSGRSGLHVPSLAEEEHNQGRENALLKLNVKGRQVTINRAQLILVQLTVIGANGLSLIQPLSRFQRIAVAEISSYSVNLNVLQKLELVGTVLGSQKRKYHSHTQG